MRLNQKCCFLSVNLPPNPTFICFCLISCFSAFHFVPSYLHILLPEPHIYQSSSHLSLFWRDSSHLLFLSSPLFVAVPLLYLLPLLDFTSIIFPSEEFYSSRSFTPSHTL